MVFDCPQSGATPLYSAAICGDAKTVNLLLDNGADPEVPGVSCGLR